MTTADSDGVIRVALIGYGLGGSAFHAPLIAATPGMELAAVVTSNPGRQEEVRQDHPGATVISSADEIWASAGSYDLAVIASANRAHVPQAMAALNAGLHVVVDKPLAASSTDARAVVELARERRRKLTVFQNRRWDGDFLTVRKLVGDGSLGKVLRFESRFERWRPESKPGWRELSDPEEAGGILFDLGSHLIDQALVLFGPAREVYAELDRRRPGGESDDDAFVAITHDSGVRSHLFMSALVAQQGPRFRVLGSEAGYVKYGLDVQEAALRDTRRVQHDGWGEEPRESWGMLGVDGSLTPVPTERGNYVRFYMEVEAAIRNAAPLPVDPANSMAVLDVIERARTAAS
jgi:predicted dehydrogenase